MEYYRRIVSEAAKPEGTIKGGSIGILIALFLFMTGESGLGGICCMGSMFALFVGLVQHSNQVLNPELENVGNNLSQQNTNLDKLPDIDGLVWAEDANGSWGWVDKLDNQVANMNAGQIPEHINISPEIISALKDNNGNLESLSTNELKALSSSFGMNIKNREGMISDIRDSEAAKKSLKVALATVATGGAVAATGVAIATKKELAKKALDSVGLRINNIDDINNWLKSSGISAGEIIDSIDPNGNGFVDKSEFAAFAKSHTGALLPNWMIKQIFDTIEPGNKGSITIVALLAHLESIGIETGTDEITNEDSTAEIEEGEDSTEQFRIGDRLEAVVRGHPDTIAVASIKAINDENLTIHFDGWNVDHDYVTTIDLYEIYPVGTQEALGRELHPPYRYDGVFTWDEYLATIGARAAPKSAFEVITEKDAKIKAEEDAKIKAEDDARIKAEEDARIKAEEDAKIKAEEDARIKAEEDAKIKAEDDDDDDSYDEINSELELLIEELHATKLRGEREKIIASNNSTFRTHLKIISIERTLMAEKDYRGGKTAMSLLDGGPFTAQFMFNIDDSQYVSTKGENSSQVVLCSVVDYKSSIKSVLLSVKKILD